MASAGEQHQGILGLLCSGMGVDWRRWMCFLEPLPRSQYLDRRLRLRQRAQLSLLTPRYHNTFAGCYARSASKSYACTLDAESFRQHDVAVGRGEDLVYRQTRCWNIGGCDTAGATYGVPQDSSEEDFQYQSGAFFTAA